jgi:hypothetical protein
MTLLNHYGQPCQFPALMSGYYGPHPKSINDDIDMKLKGHSKHVAGLRNFKHKDNGRLNIVRRVQSLDCYGSCSS